jgi:hypothetical protein
MLTKPYDEILIGYEQLNNLRSDEQILNYLLFCLECDEIECDEIEWHDDEIRHGIVVRYKRNLLQYG